MKNLTLSVDEDVLQRVRKLAVERNTTVTQMLREHLETLARETDRTGEERAQEFLRVMREMARPAGGEKFDREALYDRPILRRH